MPKKCFGTGDGNRSQNEWKYFLLNPIFPTQTTFETASFFQRGMRVGLFLDRRIKKNGIFIAHSDHAQNYFPAEIHTSRVVECTRRTNLSDIKFCFKLFNPENKHLIRRNYLLFLSIFLHFLFEWSSITRTLYDIYLIYPENKCQYRCEHSVLD